MFPDLSGRFWLGKKKEKAMPMQFIQTALHWHFLASARADFGAEDGEAQSRNGKRDAAIFRKLGRARRRGDEVRLFNGADGEWSASANRRARTGRNVITVQRRHDTDRRT